MQAFGAENKNVSLYHILGECQSRQMYNESIQNFMDCLSISSIQKYGSIYGMYRRSIGRFNKNLHELLFCKYLQQQHQVSRNKRYCIDIYGLNGNVEEGFIGDVEFTKFGCSILTWEIDEIDALRYENGNFPEHIRANTEIGYLDITNYCIHFRVVEVQCTTPSA